MAIIKKEQSSKKQIDTTGSDGNAFVLMGYAKQYALQLNLKPGPILAEMTDGDYDHLLTVFDKHFGDYVDLIVESDEE